MDASSKGGFSTGVWCNKLIILLFHYSLPNELLTQRKVDLVHCLLLYKFWLQIKRKPMLKYFPHSRSSQCLDFHYAMWSDGNKRSSLKRGPNVGNNFILGPASQLRELGVKSSSSQTGLLHQQKHTVIFIKENTAKILCTLSNIIQSTTLKNLLYLLRMNTVIHRATKSVRVQEPCRLIPLSQLTDRLRSAGRNFIWVLFAHDQLPHVKNHCVPKCCYQSVYGFPVLNVPVRSVTTAR
jgi:hypothetical protein